jgi:hypothetical protein
MMKKPVILLLLISMLARPNAKAQIEIPEIDIKNFSLDQLLGRVLQVKKGWAPQFFSGKSKIPKINIVRDLLGTKKNTEINKLFSTFKTGRLVYRITNYAGSAIALYGAIKKIAENKDSVVNDAKTLIISGLSSMSVGTVVKLLTKGASYKAVDLFGGVIKKKLLDIISFDMGPGVNYIGKTNFKAGLYIKL